MEEAQEAGELDDDIPPIKEVCALDLLRESFQELIQREELKPDFERINRVVERLGY